MTWKAAARNTLLVALVAAAYVGIRIYQRQASDAEFQERQLRKREKPLPEIYKSDTIEILTFYTEPRAIARGGKASLCYGVLNAASLSVEPNVGELSPSMSRCVNVSPAGTTTYKLTVRDEAGAEKTAETTLTVR